MWMSCSSLLFFLDVLFFCSSWMSCSSRKVKVLIGHIDLKVWGIIDIITIAEDSSDRGQGNEETQAPGALNVVPKCSRS